MVSSLTRGYFDWGVGLLAQATSQTAFERMGPRERVRILAALGVILVLSLFLLFFVRLTARMARRYMNQTPFPRPPLSPDDWAEKPLIPTPGRSRRSSMEGPDGVDAAVEDDDSNDDLPAEDAPP